MIASRPSRRQPDDECMTVKWNEIINIFSSPRTRQLFFLSFFPYMKMSERIFIFMSSNIIKNNRRTSRYLHKKCSLFISTFYAMLIMLLIDKGNIFVFNCFFKFNAAAALPTKTTTTTQRCNAQSDPLLTFHLRFRYLICIVQNRWHLTFHTL